MKAARHPAPSRLCALLIPFVVALHAPVAQAQTPPGAAPWPTPSTAPSATPPPGGDLAAPPILVSPAPSPTRSISASQLGQPPRIAADGALDRLHTQLQLTADQEPAWQRLVRELDAATGQLLRERPVLAGLQETGPQQIARLGLQMQNRLAALEGIEKATRELYAVLSTEQQAAVNQGLLSTLPPLLGGLQPMAAPRDGVTERRGEGMMRSRRGGIGGGVGGGGGLGGGMRP